MSLITKISLAVFHKFVGSDEFGNKYYIAKSKDRDGNYKRSVIYNGIAEPSKIPPMWHAWLHYSLDQIPKYTKSYKWQVDHSPNLTGTILAYKPNALMGGTRPKATGDYESWRP